MGNRKYMLLDIGMFWPGGTSESHLIHVEKKKSEIYLFLY